jgi:hypothetical protein
MLSPTQPRRKSFSLIASENATPNSYTSSTPQSGSRVNELLTPIQLFDPETETIISTLSHISSLFIVKGFDFEKKSIACTLLLRGWQHPLRVNSVALDGDCQQFRKRTTEGCTYNVKLPVIHMEGFNCIPFRISIVQVTIEFESAFREEHGEMKNKITNNFTPNLCMRVHPVLDSTDFIRVNDEAFDGEGFLSKSPEICLIEDRFLEGNRPTVCGFKLRWYRLQSPLKYAFEATVPITALWFCSLMLWLGGYDSSTNFQVLSTGLLSLIVILQQQVDVEKTHELAYAIFLLCTFGLMFAEFLWPFCLMAYAIGTPLLYVWSRRRYRTWLKVALSDTRQFMQNLNKDKIKSGQLNDLEFRGIKERLDELGIRTHKQYKVV